MENLNHISELILQQFSQKGWDNYDKYVFELFPFDNKSKIKFRYILFTFTRLKKGKKGKNVFSCQIEIESFEYCILTVEESERKINRDNEDFITFSFDVPVQKTFRKCIKKTMEYFTNIKICESCNRINYKTSMDKDNICLTCNIQYLFEIRKDEGCTICIDKDCIKLVHRLPCEHEFHFSCLTKLTKKECPLCRACFSLRKK
jgi:hypothetical protein